jgi:hypothetical protein
MSRFEQVETRICEQSEISERRSDQPLKTEDAGSARKFEQVEPGIYKNSKNGKYFERPLINGKRTWRALGGKNLKLAREEFYRRRTAVSAGTSPYLEAATEETEEEVARTVGDIIRRYQEDNCLDGDLLERPPETRADEDRHCTTLLQFWDEVEVARVTDRICDNYRDWRVKNIKQGEGLRTTDRELNTLNNAFRYCKRRDFVRVNPVADRPRYQPKSRVKHCREFMAGDADELHSISAELFKNRHSQVLGWQMLAEAYSGLRGCEVLRWRANPGPEDPGFVTADGKSIRVWRCKNQHLNNPYISVNAGMAALLKAHRKWKAEYYPDSEWFFPGHERDSNEPVSKGALAHALRRISKDRPRKIKPHGNRAFYVTVRRSWGTLDGQIAVEIGHSSGGSTLESVYGGVPPNWLSGEAPKLNWLPLKGKPAWDMLKPDEDSSSKVD